MYLRRSSAVGRRFLASIREGHGLKPPARAAGIGKETGYRWLREAFVELREAGVSVVEAQQQLGYSSPLVLEWEQARLAAGPERRHHLAHGLTVEETFWAAFDRGAGLAEASQAASVGRATGYRWWQRRFDESREQSASVRRRQRLRVTPKQAERWEADRRARLAGERRTVAAADARAIRSAARQAALLTTSAPTRSQLRDVRYWQSLADKHFGTKQVAPGRDRT